MTDTEHLIPTLKLKQPSTAEIEKAIAEGLSKLVGGEHIFSVSIGSTEWHTFELKMSLTVRPAYLDREDEGTVIGAGRENRSH